MKSGDWWGPQIQNMDQLCRLESVEHGEVGRDWKGFSPQKVWSPKMSPYVNNILFDTIPVRTKTRKKQTFITVKTPQLYRLWYNVRATGRPEIKRDSSSNCNGFAQNNRISFPTHIYINRNMLTWIQVRKTYTCTQCIITKRDDAVMKLWVWISKTPCSNTRRSTDHHDKGLRAFPHYPQVNVGHFPPSAPTASLQIPCRSSDTNKMSTQQLRLF